MSLFVSSIIDFDVPVNKGGACGGFLKVVEAIIDVVRGRVEEGVVYVVNLTVRGLNSLKRAENLAVKRRGKARTKATPTKSAMLRRCLDRFEDASLRVCGWG
jgi:hypothetical protein